MSAAFNKTKFRKSKTRMFSSLKRKKDVEIDFIDPRIKERQKIPKQERLPINVTKNAIVFGTKQNFLRVVLHRTLVIPDDGKKYELPPSLGKFPIKKVDDYKSSVPSSWIKHGGVFFPMCSREAMWMQFECYNQDGIRPKALKVGIGKINAINGFDWKNELDKKQDYLVCPDQPWLDGIKTKDGEVKQFLAMGLGSGYTVEGQISGEEKFGGVQLICYESNILIPKKVNTKQTPQLFYGKVHPKKPIKNDNYYKHGRKIKGFGKKKGQKKYMDIQECCSDEEDCDMEYSVSLEKKEKKKRKKSKKSVSVPQRPVGNMSNQRYEPNYPDVPEYESQMSEVPEYEPTDVPDYDESVPEYDSTNNQIEEKAMEMGIGAGGSLKQKVYKDKYGYESWNQNKFGRVYIHIVNSKMYQQITGSEPPECPITKKTYQTYGFPFYELNDDDNKKDVETTGILNNIKTVKQIDDESFAPVEDEPVFPGSIIKITNPGEVRDGEW